MRQRSSSMFIDSEWEFRTRLVPFRCSRKERCRYIDCGVIALDISRFAARQDSTKVAQTDNTGVCHIARICRSIKPPKAPAAHTTWYMKEEATGELRCLELI